MNIKIALIVGGLLLAAVAVLFLIPGGDPLPAPAPKQWVLFVDTSGSVSGEQSLHWQEMADKAIGRFKPSDSLTIYELNDHTLENTALLFRETDPITGSGVDELVKKRRQAEHIKKEAKEVLQDLLNASKRSNSSAVFDGIDRVKLDPHRRPIVVWLSDMLNSSEQDPNLEKTSLTQVNFADAITNLARRHQWHSETLAQADVHVILPSAGATKPLNDRRMMKQFFTVLFHSLGANLITFDTAYSAKLS